MSAATFRALVLRQSEGKTSHAIENLSVDDLPEGEVLVKVSHSSLNYKDGLAITGKGKIVRRFPFVPGIDFAGTVEASSSPDYKAGDAVVLTGWGVGERHYGGHAEKARVKAGWLTPLPAGLTPAQAMAIGTAGFTAMLSVMALGDHGLTPQAGPVLVTGASGGVGSVAVALLAKSGYQVTAATGRPEQHAYLRELGAVDFIDRAELDQPAKPLDSERWAGAVDNVGGRILASVLSQMRYGGAVAAVGLAGSSDLPTTVFPFILRGVALLGIDSVMCPPPRRVQAWQRLAAELDQARLEAMTKTVSLDELPAQAEAITNGQVRGRVVVDLTR